MRRYTLYNQLMAVAAGLCLCWLCVACGEDRRGGVPPDEPQSCVGGIPPAASPPGRPPPKKTGATNTWGDDGE